MRLLSMSRMLQRGPVGLDELDRWVLIRWERRRPRYAQAQLGLAEHRPACWQPKPQISALRDCPWSIAGCWLSSLPGPPRMAG